jgi:hypothetical protein
MSIVNFQTPVLLIAWRRPEHLKQVIDAVRKAAPMKMFVAVDGPRLGADFAEERKLIEQTKSVIEKEIDWECELKTLFQDKNIGCRVGVSTAITWFFDSVEEGIILEDDCVPSIDFLLFTTKLLNKYRNDDKIMHIGGVNYLDVVKPNNYFFSQYGHIWGWATWKSRWTKYKNQLTKLDIDLALLNVPKGMQRDYWKMVFKGQLDFQVDTWDYNWQCVIFLNNGRCIYPLNTMVDNIGFDELAVHTTKMSFKPILSKSDNNNENVRIGKYWLNNTFTNKYFDHINFRRSFKRKNESVLSIKHFLKWMLNKWI